MLIDWAETRGNKQDDERGVYITGLDEKVDEAALRKHFGSYGTIVKVKRRGATDSNPSVVGLCVVISTIDSTSWACS